jgi:hypothetical protein
VPAPDPARSRRSGRARRIAAAVVAAGLLTAACLAVLLPSGGNDGARNGRQSASLGGIRDSEAANSYPEPASSRPQQLAQDPAAAAAQAPAGDDTGPSPGAPSDAEVRRELEQLQRYQRAARAGGSVETDGGQARLPSGAPPEIRDIVAGGNAIATFPYRLGGGHGSFVDDAYDCSGSVSYALAAAGLLGSPITSGELVKWGVPGPGRWLTVYANAGHVFMAVAGLRFDTSGRAGRRGSRWQTAQRGISGFAVRHWPGL